MSCHNFSLFIRVPCILFYGDLLTLKTHHYKPNSMNSMKELWKNSIEQSALSNCVIRQSVRICGLNRHQYIKPQSSFPAMHKVGNIDIFVFA